MRNCYGQRFAWYYDCIRGLGLPRPDEQTPEWETQTMSATATAAKKPAAKKTSTGFSPQRTTVLKVLRKGHANLEQIVSRSKLPERAAYHHLWHLRKDGFVKSFEVNDDSLPGRAEVRFELTA